MTANKDLSCVSVHHEQAAAFAAVSYADYTHNFGACLVSTGCASTNTLTGVLNAWQDGIPCMFISGQNKLQETTGYTGLPIRTYGQQEQDIVSIVKPITKYAVMITDPKKIVFEFQKAFHLMNSGRKGPVFIDVPLDVQNMRIKPETLEIFTPEESFDDDPTPDDINYLIHQINHFERPALLIGSGVKSAKCIAELQSFIEQSEIPLTYATSAVDTYGMSHKLSIGSVGAMGCSRSGNFTIQNSDLLIVLGHRLSSMTTGTEFHKFAREAKVIVIDIDRIEHSKNGVNIDRLIVADVKKVLSELIKNKNLKKTSKEWQEKCFHWKRSFPSFENYRKDNKRIDLYYLAESFAKVLPSHSTFITDSGLNELILPSNISFSKNQRCIHPVSQGSMGAALASLVGAHYASENPVIAVIGDGSIMMNLQELQTIKTNNIPAKIFVINNNAYAIIRKRQLELFGRRTIGTDSSNGLECPNFKKIADGFDLCYECIDDSRNLEEKLKTIIDIDGSVLCEIMGLENQSYIKMAYTRNLKKRFVQRPLEDQSPFIDREVFLSEMIVEPIDQ